MIGTFAFVIALILFVCATVGVIGAVILGWARAVSDFDPCNVGSEE